MRVLIIGATGQLGSDLVKVLKDEDLVALRHKDLEISDFGQVKAKIKYYSADVVINTAAYNKVDQAEAEVDLAFAVNGIGARNVAVACRESGSVLVHISTDYVFDGEKGAPYVEEDVPHPINAYGISKLAGEYFVKYIMDKYFLIRTAVLFGTAGGLSIERGGNFVEVMLRLAEKGVEIRVVKDQVVSPTYSWDLARKIGELIETTAYGIYHITNGGECSRYEFAKRIFKLAGISVKVRSVTGEEYGARARRPKYSVLENHRLGLMGRDDLRNWAEALVAYLAERRAFI